MEKRKDAAGYQHQCFTMMVLLNVIIVLFGGCRWQSDRLGWKPD